MKIIAGRDVPKDGRTNAEVSANSAQIASPPGVGDRKALIGAAGDRLRFDRFVLDAHRGCLLEGEREVALRPKTFQLLRYLAGNPGRLVSKDELLATVWPAVFVSDDLVVQCITELRRAMDDRDQRLIKTVPRRGYRFDVMPVAEPAPPHSTGTLVQRAGVREPRSRRTPFGNVNLAWQIGALALAAAIGGAVWWSGLRDRSTGPPTLSIAVMPFEELSGDADQPHLTEGLAYDVTTELSRLPDLFVIAYATARTFKEANRDAREVGRELNVRYLLDGSVHRSGDQIRINVQLIDTATGASVWGDRFERRRDQAGATT